MKPPGATGLDRPGDAMYTQGIEQGKAGYAAAIGVLLAIGVMVVSLVNRHLLERS